MLDATIDFKNHTSSLDGFAAANGGDTQITEDDHMLLEKFVKSLESMQKDPPAVAMLLRRVASIWSQTGSAMLERRVMGDEGRGYTSRCGSTGRTVRTTTRPNRWNTATATAVAEEAAEAIRTTWSTATTTTTVCATATS